MAVSQLAARIKPQLRKRPSIAKDIELWAFAELGFRVSEESIRKALKGQIDPTQCSVELLVTLAAWFEVAPDDLGHHAAARIRPMVAYASTVPTPEGGPGLPVARSRCTALSLTPKHGGTLLRLPFADAA